MRIDIELEEWDGSGTLHEVRSDYVRWKAENYSYKATILTPRQAVFYRNLIRIALLANGSIPVDFDYRGVRVHLDRGCIGIAEHAGFIERLANGPSGLVDTIRLAWQIDGTSVI